MKNDKRDRSLPPPALGGNPFESLRGRFPVGDQAPPAEPDRERREAPSEQTPRGRLVVRREKKGRGGKTMTRVSGLELTESELADFARELRRALGCGAIVEHRDVLIQGAQTERAAAWLRGRGYAKIVIGN